MAHTFLSADPNYQRPYILYTRAWKKREADTNALEEQSSHAGLLDSPGRSPLPICTNNYVDLRAFVLQDLKSFGQTSGRDVNNSPAITARHITLGQIEYMTAQVDLCRDMLKFSLFTSDRNSIKADFSNARRLFADLFAIVEVTDADTVKMKSTEGLHLMKLRAMVLEAIIILCDLRANYRISLAVDAYERIFEEMEKERTVVRKSLYRRSESQSSFTSGTSSEYGDSAKATLLEKMFCRFQGIIEELFHGCFASSIVCPDQIGADKVHQNYEGNKVLDCLLGLSAYGDRGITENVISLVFRQASQHVRFTRDLSMVKVLVYPKSVAVFQKTNDTIRRFSGTHARTQNFKSRIATKYASILVRAGSANLTGSLNEWQVSKIGLILMRRMLTRKRALCSRISRRCWWSPRKIHRVNVR